MPELGHMAYYVRNLERSVTFYEKVVGLTVVGRIFKGRAAVLSGGRSHHELLLIQVSTADGPLTGRRIGLYHAGWKVGDSLIELKEALDRAQLYGYNVDSATDHRMMFSLYLRDPDENEVELFVDNPDYDWNQDTTWMEAPARPLDLSLSCLNRDEKARLKASKAAERTQQVPLAKPQSSVTPEEMVQQSQLRPASPPSVQSINLAATQQLPQAPAPSKVQPMLFQTQLQGETKPDRTANAPNSTPLPRHQVSGSDRSSIPPREQPRPLPESRVRSFQEPELEQRQEQAIRYTQPPSPAGQQPSQDAGSSEVTQPQARANHKLEETVTAATKTESGLVDVQDNGGAEKDHAIQNTPPSKVETLDLTRRGPVMDSQYPMEQAAA